MTDDEPIRPGIMEYLEAARTLGLKIGVASSSKHDWVDGHLSRLGILSLFDIIRCADDVTFAKPSPDLYYLTCGNLGAAPDETVVVEDSPNGLRAAVRAGTFAIAFPNPLTSHLDLSHATLQVEDLRTRPLPSILEIMARTRKSH